MSAQHTSLSYDSADPDKMKLPADSTCGDCAHIRRCKAMFGHVESDIYCDWAPSRFYPIAKAPNGVDNLPATPTPTSEFTLTPAMRAEAAAFAAATCLDGESLEQAGVV